MYMNPRSHMNTHHTHTHTLNILSLTSSTLDGLVPLQPEHPHFDRCRAGGNTLSGASLW